MKKAIAASVTCTSVRSVTMPTGSVAPYPPTSLLPEVISNQDESNISYTVKNNVGQQCYAANEQSDVRHRLQDGNMRDFTIHIVDNTGQEVARAHRESRGRCVGCACSTCCISDDSDATTINVESPVGNSIGRIIQLPSNWTLRYAIQGTNNCTVFVLEIPSCMSRFSCSAPADEQFGILTADESIQIGTLTHLNNSVASQTSGIASSEYDIKFPMNLDVKVKATVLCAAFFIDVFMFGPRFMRKRPRQ